MQENGKIMLATLCHTSSCCPVLELDRDEVPGRQIVLTDDFGKKVQLSRTQLARFRDLAKQGAFDWIESLP